MKTQILYASLLMTTAGCLLSTRCTSQHRDSAHLYTDPQFRFRIACPDSGWALTDTTGIQEVLVIIRSEKTTEDFVPNVTVAIEPLSFMMTAEEYGKKNLRSLKTQEYEIMSNEKRVIHHNVLYELHCLHQDTEPILRFRQLCLVRERIGFIITCTAPERCYHRYENDFKLIVNSFRFI